MTEKKISTLEDFTEEELRLLKTIRDKNLSAGQIKDLEARLRAPSAKVGDRKNSGDRWKMIDYEVPAELLEGKDHIDILLWGDVHYGSKFCDYNMAKQNLDDSARRGLLIIGMGDLLETATRSSVGSGVYDQQEIVQEQLETMKRWLAPHKDRIIGLLDGNHEERVYKESGLNLTKILCQESGTKYLGAGRLIRIRVGQHVYSLYVTHGSSGATLPYTKIKRCLELRQYIDADLYAMGHVHALDSHSRAVHSVNNRRRTVEEHEHLFVLTGHYLNYFESYAHRKGLIPSKKGSPVIKLYKNEHKIRVSI